MTDLNRGRSPARGYNQNVDHLRGKVNNHIQGQFAGGRRDSLVEGRRLTENRANIRQSTVAGVPVDRSPARARGSLTNFETYANRDIDEAQHLANAKRGGKKVDVSNIGLSYDHMAVKLGGNQPNRYDINYREEGQIVAQKRTRQNVGRTEDGSILKNLEGKFVNKFFQRYRIPTEESEEIPEPPAPEPFPMSLCWTLIIFWICFLIWTIIMSSTIDDLGQQFQDLQSLKVFRDMTDELDVLAKDVQKKHLNLDDKIKRHEKDLKMNQPKLTHLANKYNEIAKKIKALQAEAKSDLKDISELKKFQIVVNDFMRKFIRFVDIKGSNSKEKIKKTIRGGSSTVKKKTTSSD